MFSFPATISKLTQGNLSMTIRCENYFKYFFCVDYSINNCTLLNIYPKIKKNLKFPKTNQQNFIPFNVVFLYKYEIKLKLGIDKP